MLYLYICMYIHIYIYIYICYIWLNSNPPIKANESSLRNMDEALAHGGNIHPFTSYDLGYHSGARVLTHCHIYIHIYTYIYIYIIMIYIYIPSIPETSSVSVSGAPKIVCAFFLNCTSTSGGRASCKHGDFMGFKGKLPKKNGRFQWEHL